MILLLLRWMIQLGGQGEGVRRQKRGGGRIWGEAETRNTGGTRPQANMEGRDTAR